MILITNQQQQLPNGWKRSRKGNAYYVAPDGEVITVFRRREGYGISFYSDEDGVLYNSFNWDSEQEAIEHVLEALDESYEPEASGWLGW